MSLLVFSDMDGTFVTDDKNIPQQNLAALDALYARHAGWFVPCTGRPASALPPELLAHPACRFVVSANGGQIHEVLPTGELELLSQTPLGRSRAHELVDALIGHDVTFDIFTAEGAFDRQSDYDRMDQFVAPGPALDFVHKVRTPRGNDIRQIINDVLPIRMTIFYTDDKSRDAVLMAIEQIGDLSCVSSMPHEFEISDQNATKGSALMSLTQVLKQRSDTQDIWQSVAFGDSSNDIPVLRVADLSFAMKNATPEAISAAQKVTAFDNNHAGVGHEILALLDSVC